MPARPEALSGFEKWRQRLFASPRDAVISLISGIIVLWVGAKLFNWAILKADWFGESRAVCTSGGACWAFITDRFNQFIYGFYPTSEQWRVNLVALFFLAGTAAAIKGSERVRKTAAILMFTVYPIAAFFLLTGDVLGLVRVPTAQWGGLMLTLVIAIVGIVVSLPLGIMLALGRRSQLPVVSTASVIFIEFWRGVPLITVLFMASVMLPFFMPPGMEVDKLLRVLIGVTLFSSAYMAEVVRGGLQAIPRGQGEAAASLGLNYRQNLIYIILPQALRKVIPGIVNTFIGLFKDTTLVLIVGMFDLLGMVQAAATDPDWLGHAMEGYIFAGAVFWIFCFVMSRYSLKLEKTGVGGIR